MIFHKKATPLPPDGSASAEPFSNPDVAGSSCRACFFKSSLLLQLKAVDSTGGGAVHAVEDRIGRYNAVWRGPGRFDPSFVNYAG